jgi:hypothetical protein
MQTIPLLGRFNAEREFAGFASMPRRTDPQSGEKR